METNGRELSPRVDDEQASLAYSSVADADELYFGVGALDGEGMGIGVGMG